MDDRLARETNRLARANQTKARQQPKSARRRKCRTREARNRFRPEPAGAPLSASGLRIPLVAAERSQPAKKKQNADTGTATNNQRQQDSEGCTAAVDFMRPRNSDTVGDDVPHH